MPGGCGDRRDENDWETERIVSVEMTVTRPTEWAQDGDRARVFSGHESFAVRYGWLPKIYEAVTADPLLFSSDERAILALGLGRNMVKSIRFWSDAFGLTSQDGRKVSVTDFAHRLFARDGFDPYLEDPNSLWRLHWRISTRAGLGAWTIVFQETLDPEISRERLIEKLRTRAASGRGAITEGTAAAHADMLIRTYASDAGENASVAEETLGSPFQELGLLSTGATGGKAVVRLTRGQRGDLAPSTLAYAVHDFWTGTASKSRLLSMRSLLLDRRSPGVIFRMDENALLQKLEQLCDITSAVSLQEDGVGGVNLVATDDAFDELERVAWA
jgi:hypothetical protein